jgi:hypothetical protein
MDQYELVLSGIPSVSCSFAMSAVLTESYYSLVCDQQGARVAQSV